MKLFAAKKRLAVILLLIIAVNTVTILIYFSGRQVYTLCIPTWKTPVESVDVKILDDTVLECTGTEVKDGFVQVHLRAKMSGQTDTEVHVRFAGKDLSASTKTAGIQNDPSPSTKLAENPGITAYTDYSLFQVNRFQMLLRRGIFDFNGWQVIFFGIMISLVLFAVLMILEFRDMIRLNLYSYQTMQTGGVAVLFTGISLLYALVAFIIFVLSDYREYQADTVFSFSRELFSAFIMFSIPFVIVLVMALSVSNIRLIQKEGIRKVNLLGIALSGILAGGVALSFILPRFFIRVNTSNEELFSNIQFAISAVFSFLLSFLVSTMLCGLIAAKRVPARNQDYIIILGCSIRKDGTLYPLLQGRVDRAIRFWKRQIEETGKQAVFIPSGGRGRNEIMSEAEAMRRYLLEKGIPDECIIPETQSVNTLQNMAFSKAIIDRQNMHANVIFSTTNYHVLRSGIIAGQVGLKANGIGSRTKWYFWPNAFVREFAGLLYHRRKFELLFIAAVAAGAVMVRLIIDFI